MAGNRYVRALDLSAGFGDFERRARCFLMCWGSGVNRVIGGVWRVIIDDLPDLKEKFREMNGEE